MGVKLAISTDAHSVNALEYMRFGVDQARRGCLEPADVINTRPLPELRKLLKLSFSTLWMRVSQWASMVSNPHGLNGLVEPDEIDLAIESHPPGRAMVAGVTKHLWEIDDIVAVLEAWESTRRSLMVDIVELQNVAKNLRAWARQIRCDNETASYATSGEDSGLLESAANAMERAADAIERLRNKT